MLAHIVQNPVITNAHQAIVQGQNQTLMSIQYLSTPQIPLAAQNDISALLANQTVIANTITPPIQPIINESEITSKNWLMTAMFIIIFYVAQTIYIEFEEY